MRRKRVLIYDLDKEEHAEDMTNSVYSNKDIIDGVHRQDQCRQRGIALRKYLGLNNELTDIELGKIVEAAYQKKSRVKNAKIEML